MAIEKKRKRSEPAKTAVPVNPAAPAVKVTSLLKADEAFPRGGGSVLTPFEYKEATNEAKKDALFDEANDAAATKPSKRRKSGGALEHRRPAREGPRIEGLSFKRLHVGAIVLGQIAAINNLDLVVALPNNLSGFVSITNVSSILSAKLEGDQESSRGSDEHEEDVETPELSELFQLGQWVRAAIISISTGENKARSGQKQKKRIDLSLEPTATNKGLQPAHIQNRATVQAAVKSIEDHGLVMDTGIDGCSGFLKKKEYGVHAADSFKLGQVLLCSVTAAEGDRRVLQLSSDLQKNAKRIKLKSIVNVDAVLPGDGVEVLITESHNTSFSGKILGLLDATCDTFQAGALQVDANTFKAGEKVLARVLHTDSDAETRKVAVSLLPHIIDFDTVSASLTMKQAPTEAMPIGFVLDQVIVMHVEPSVGLFCETGINHVLGFVHISRISQGKVESLNANTGRYKVGSQHTARIVGYNPVDGMFLLSMEQNVIDTKYLNVNDISVGEHVDGTIEKFVQGGVLVKISEGMTGLVPDNHISDVKLQFPEKKFKVGLSVQCRVLDTDATRRRVILTMKKSLVNSDVPIIMSFENVQVGSKSIGVISKLFDNGALIQFYAGVHGFLPSSEMSEAYISNPKEHFRIGQTLSVRLLKLDVEEKKMTLSCRDSTMWDNAKESDFASIKCGTICSATVTEKTSDKLVVTLNPSGFNATLDVGHLSDSDFARCDKLFQKVRVGGHLKEVLVLDKQVNQRQLILSMKPSLLKTAKDKSLPAELDEVRIGQKLQGFVRKATDYGVLVGFANGLTGLALKHNLSSEYVSMPASIFSALQSVSCTVIEIDEEQKRFQVTLKDEQPSSKDRFTQSSSGVNNPVDSSLTSISDVLPGKVLTARITSVKDTQLNIELAESLQGRVDVSSVFDNVNDIKSKRHPLKQYKVGEEIKVKIVGYHDAKNHKFLPLSHRQKSTKTIFECSLRPSDIKSNGVSMFDFKDVKEGAVYTAFVNNFGSDCLWVNISPAVRGRINVLDLATEVKSVAAVQQLYSLGSAIKCRAVRFAPSTKHLDLSERALEGTAVTSLDSIKVGSILPARITRVSDSGILAQLSDDVAGRISLTDMSDDYVEQPTKGFQKNGLVQVTVKSVDVPNKRISLSLRSASPEVVRDPEINSIKDISIGQTLRGYVKNVADQGLFVELGRDVVARVKIGETSDAFIKDWKKGFSADQLVTGKVIAIDPKSRRVEFSLKKNAKVQAQQTGLSDLKVDQVVEGIVKKIEDFGMFVQVTSVPGVSGLCHKSEIADKPVKDIAAIYTVGDLVKAKILDINIEKRRISFGLKSSYFNTSAEAVDDDDGRDSDRDVDMDQAESATSDSADGEDEEDGDDGDHDDEDDGSAMSEDDAPDSTSKADEAQALQVEDFDWTGKSVFQDAPLAQENDESDSDNAASQPKKKAKRAKKSYDDSATDQGTKEPSSVSDFERLLLGRPDSSIVWIQYMAFHMQLSDFEAARAVGERALTSINYRLETEKLNIWMALLNLENNFGSQTSLDETFKRSLEFNDPLDMYSRLVGTFIRSGKVDRAIETYDAMLKKFGSRSTKTWVEYATFLASHERLEEARSLLPRALKSLPSAEHVALLTKMACLEFRRGDAERGRTLFEGLLSSHPKRLDLWNVLIDMEATQPPSSSSSGPAVVRELFDRVLATKLSTKKAKGMFKKWLQYEKDHGEEDDVERVKARAIAYVESH